MMNKQSYTYNNLYKTPGDDRERRLVSIFSIKSDVGYKSNKEVRKVSVGSEKARVGCL